MMFKEIKTGPLTDKTPDMTEQTKKYTSPKLFAMLVMTNDMEMVIESRRLNCY